MANNDDIKRKKPHDPFEENYNIDDEWEIDSSWDDFDSTFENINVPKEDGQKNRKPQSMLGTYGTDALKGISLGAADRLKRNILDSVPNVGRLADDAMGFISDISSIKAELLKNGSKMTSQFKQLTRSISPTLNKVLPDNLKKKLDEFNKEDTTDRSYGSQSDEEYRKSFISDEVAKTLKLQTAQQVEESSERKVNLAIDRKLSEIRHKDVTQILEGMRQETSWQTEFYKSVATGYFSKSLELKYQHLFISKDILATIQTGFKSFDNKLDGILKNSSLPDIQKQRLFESYKNVARGALMSRFNNKISLKAGNIFKALTKKFKNKIDDTMDTLGSAIDQAQTMVDMNNMVSEMGGMMGDGVKQANPIASTGVELGGNFLGEFIADRFSPETIRKLSKLGLGKPEAMLRNYKARLASKIGHLDRYEKEGYTEDDTLLTKAGKTARNTLFSLLNDVVNTGDSVENTLTQKATDTTQFDVATRQSIVEIIPGYLAKILQQVTTFNTGKETDELVFDEYSRDFISSNEYMQKFWDRNIANTTDKNNKHVYSSDYFDKSTAAISSGISTHATTKEEHTDSKTYVKEHRKDIDKIMSNIASSNMSLEPLWIKEYVDHMSDEWYNYSNYNIPRYIDDLLRGVEDKKTAIIILRRAFITPDGKVDHSTVANFLDAVYSLAGDDSFKDALNDVIASGKGRFFTKQGYFTQNERYDSNFRLNTSGINQMRINDYDREDSSRKTAAEYDKFITEKLNEGLTIDDLVKLVPTEFLRKFLRNRVSQETLNKKRFADKQYNDFGKFDDTTFINTTTPTPLTNSNNEEAITTANTGNRVRPIVQNTVAPTSSITPAQIILPNDTTIKTIVTATQGEHVLSSYLKSIVDNTSVSRNITDETDLPAKRHEATITILTDIKGILENQLVKFDEWRQQFQAMSVAQMEFNRVLNGGTSNKSAWGSMWRAIGNISGGLVKGTGSVMSGSIKGIWGFGKAVTVPALVAMGKIVPGMLKGGGSLIGGAARGIGTILGGKFGIFRANYEAMKLLANVISSFGPLGANAFKFAKKMLGAVPGVGLVGKAFTDTKNLFFGKKNESSNQESDSSDNSILNTGTALRERAADLYQSAKDRAGGILSKFDTEDIAKKFKGIKAIYSANKDTPLLTIQDFAGKLYSKGKDGRKILIKSIEDIVGPIEDENGNIKISLEDIKAGLFTDTAKPLTDYSSKFKSFVNKHVKGFTKKVSTDPKLKEAMTKIKSLGADWRDTNLGTLLETAGNATGSIKDKAKEFYENNKDKVSDIQNKLRGKSSNDDKQDKKEWKGLIPMLLNNAVAPGIKAITKNMFAAPGTITNGLMHMGLDALKFGGKTAGNLINRLFGFDKKDKNVIPTGIDKEDLEVYVTSRLDEIIKILYDIRPKKVVGDADNDGDREGSYEDYLQRRKADKEKLEQKRAAAANKNNKDKSNTNNEENGGFLSTILNLFGGSGLVKKFNSVRKLLIGGIGGILKKLLSAKGLLGIAGAILGLSLLPSKAHASEGGESEDSNTEIGGDQLEDKLRATVATASGFYVARKIGKGIMTRSAAQAAASLATTGAAATNTISTAAAGVNAANAARVAGAVGAAEAAKQESRLVKALTWLKDKLPKSWGKIMDKLIGAASFIVKKLGAKSVGMIVGKLLAGPWGIVLAAGQLVYEAGKAAFNTNELIGVSKYVEISVGDIALISAASAISNVLLLELIDVPTVAGWIGVDIDKYKKENEKVLQNLQQHQVEDIKNAEEYKKKVDNAANAGYDMGMYGIDTSTKQDDPTTKNAEKQIQKEDDFLSRAWQSTKNFFGFGSGQSNASQNQGGAPGQAVQISEGGTARSAMSYTAGNATANVGGGGAAIGGSTVDLSTLGTGNVTVGSATSGKGLGDYAIEFESGEKGPLAIGYDSTGGTSYGSYQFASKPGGTQAFLDWAAKHGGEFGKQLSTDVNAAGPLNTGSKHGAPVDVWLKYANVNGGKTLHALEQDFVLQHELKLAIKRLNDPALQNLVMTDRGVQEAFWSTVVQHGAGGGPRLFKKYYRPGMTAKDLLTAIYQNRGNHFGSSTAKVQAGVRSRFGRELNILLGLTGQPALSLDGDPFGRGGAANTVAVAPEDTAGTTTANVGGNTVPTTDSGTTSTSANATSGITNNSSAGINNANVDTSGASGGTTSSDTFVSTSEAENAATTSANTPASVSTTTSSTAPAPASTDTAGNTTVNVGNASNKDTPMSGEDYVFSEYNKYMEESKRGVTVDVDKNSPMRTVIEAREKEFHDLIRTLKDPEKIRELKLSEDAKSKDRDFTDDERKMFRKHVTILSGLEEKYKREAESKKKSETKDTTTTTDPGTSTANTPNATTSSSSMFSSNINTTNTASMMAANTSTSAVNNSNTTTSTTNSKPTSTVGNTINAAVTGAHMDPNNLDRSGFSVAGGDFENVNPNVKVRFAEAAKEYYDKTGKKMKVTSGKRSLAKQKQLYDKLGPGLAAKPNPLAPHIAGLALDVNFRDKEMNDEAERMGIWRRHGLYRPLVNGLGRTKPEHWHIEPIGSRDMSAGAKITQATLAKFGTFKPDAGESGAGANQVASRDNSADGVDSAPVASSDGEAKRMGLPTQSQAQAVNNAASKSGNVGATGGDNPFGSLASSIGQLRDALGGTIGNFISGIGDVGNSIGNFIGGLFGGGSSDNTQSTVTATNNTSMSTMPTGGSIGSTTTSTLPITDSSSTMSTTTDMSTITSTMPTPSPTDITPITNILSSMLQVLTIMAGHTTHLDQLDQISTNTATESNGTITPISTPTNTQAATKPSVGTATSVKPSMPPIQTSVLNVGSKQSALQQFA